MSSFLTKVSGFITHLSEKASDGVLTLDEVSECLKELSPEHFTDVHEEVVEALEDGKISTTEAFKIAIAVIL